MTLLRLIPFPLCLLALAACSDPEKIARYPITPPAVSKDMANRLGTAELRQISLPDYASSQEISFQTPDGALRSNPNNLWADDPARSMTLALARQISEMSGATVLSDPWPLSDPPRRRIDVRVEQLLPGADQMLHVSGLYVVSPTGFDAGGDTVRRFNFTVPIAGAEADGGAQPAAIVAAQGKAVTELARRIAGLR
ncbi:hypothetical protein DL1_17235 [Thioclava dalianensis]|uniref:ABC-type transport auxiliary lipoprotein component domain-containing protein n=1 Tax=Thioclava dalianensis TaxID=1185766 RepID=A0A074TMV9_9RHOB|nr:PqiC family protein [Thioclava dalianensis]KEP70303.1 hypothetical protein DL1_17235 [Thioclava dalianensis]SFN33896.1 hypothetical protein SAMN05216224_104198 [Thioclava dalianensis]